MSYNMSELYDMVDRKKAVDPAIKIWKERADKRWKKEDDGWEAKYDFEIAEEARREKEEEERWDNMTEEEQEAQMKEWGMLESDSDEDSDEDSDDDWGSDDNDDDEELYIRACEEHKRKMAEEEKMTPEEKKNRAREDYDKEMKELREKNIIEYGMICYVATGQNYYVIVLKLGLSNESYQSHRYHCNRKTNQLY